MNILAENLSKLREARGLKQSEVARDLGVPVPTYSSWERGRTEPSVEWLIKLAGYFETSIDRLVRSGRILSVGSWYPKFPGFHPIKNNRGFYSLIYPLVYGRLFLFDIYDKRFHTEIADSWRADRSELSYTFYIRSDVRFHNGKRLAPDDVKFSYEEFLKIDDFYRQFLDKVVVERGKNAVKLKLKKWLELHDMPAPYIIPAPGEKAPDDYYYDGCGPYKITKESREDIKKDLDNPIYLESNIDYFPTKFPGIHLMEFHRFSSIEDLRNSLDRGELNFAVDLAYEAPRFNLEHGFGDISYYLVLKQDKDICKNVDFRRAVSLGLDRSRIVEVTKALLEIKSLEFLPNRYLYNLLPESASQRDIGIYDKKAAGEYWEGAKASLGDTVFTVASAYAEEQDPVALSLVNEVVKELQAIGINSRQGDDPAEADAVVQVVKFDTAEFIYLNLCSSKSERLWGYTSPYVRDLLASGDGMVRETYEKIQDFMTSEAVFIPLLRRGRVITYTKNLNTRSRLRTTSLFYGPDCIYWVFE